MDLSELLNGASGREEEGSSSKSSPLESLKVDLDFYSDSIKEVSAEMIAEGYTFFPIFIAYQHEVNLGETILDRIEINTSWSINASSLEEFIDRGVIKEDKKAHFERKYKSANEFMCLFVIVPEGANFVFYPYK